jgi:hypothetical protein
MASKVPEYLIEIFEEAIANDNYNIDELFEKGQARKAELYKETGKGTYSLPTSKAKFLESFKKFVADKKSMSVEDYTTYIKERIADPTKPQTPNWNRPLANTPLAATGIGATKNTPVKNLTTAEKLLTPQELSQWRAYTKKQQRKVKRERKLRGERIDTTTGEVIKDPNIRSNYISQIYLRKNLRRAMKSKAYAKLTPLEKLKYISFNKRIDVMGDLIKQNPNYLLGNAEAVNALSTYVNPTTGEISKRTPTFTDLKNRRAFEIEHIDPVVTGQTQGRGAFLSNLQVLPETVHKNFKTNAETFLNKNFKNPKYEQQVNDIIEKAKELKVELRVNDVGRVGYKPKFENFLDKADDTINFYVRDPEAKKLYSQGVENLKPIDLTFNYKQLGFTEPPSTEIVQNIVNETTRPAFLGIGNQGVLMDLTKAVARSGGNLRKALPVIALGAIGVGSLAGSPVEAAEVTRPEVKKPEVGTPIKYDSNVGAIVNENTDQPASQNQILTFIKDNPLAVTAGTSYGFAAQEVPRAYKAARELGRGKVRSALGITGALKPLLTTIGTPAMTGLFETANISNRLDAGETPTEILTDPLGPALGLAFMEPFSRGAGVIRDAPKRTMAQGLRNYFNLSDVGKARPGATSAFLRLGMSPRMIAGASRFLGLPGLLLGAGLSGYDAYKNYQNQEGFLYNLLNKDE